MGDRDNLTMIDFEQKGSVLVSKKPLQLEGNPLIILELGSTDGEKAQYERFHLNMDTNYEPHIH